MSRESIAGTLRLTGAQVILRDWLSSNQVVFVDRARGGAVVDTGHVTRSAQTVALVQHVLGELPLSRIVNTHLHSDHCGGNSALVDRWPDATIGVPEGYRDRLDPWDDDRLSYRHMGQLCGLFRPAQYLGAGHEVELGGLRWQCHSTPGHDPDALVLYQPDSRLLLSGDALWEDRLAIIFPALTGESGFDAAHDALDTIERLRPLAVIPGHGEPFGNVDAALKASRRRLDAFAAAPDRHRRYSLRVMVMYHLLERREVEREALIRWIIETPIFRDAMACRPGESPSREQATEIVDSLVFDGQLQSVHSRITLAAG